MQHVMKLQDYQDPCNPGSDGYIVMPSYIEKQFLELAIKVLPKLKIAQIIVKAVWDQRGDIRDVISIGK